MLETVFVRFRAHVCHGVGGERHVEPRLIGLARSRFNTGPGGNACDDHLCNALCLQLGFEVSAGKCALCPLRNDDVAGLVTQLRDKVSPSLGQYSLSGWLFRPPRRPTGDIDKYNWQPLCAKRID